MGRILIGNVRGPQGIPGKKGDDGDVGPRGPAGPPGSVDNTTPIEFTEAAQRANLVSGDSIATLFGKQKKWNADMKDVAFSGSYNDLTDVPVTKRESIPRGSDLDEYTDSGEFYYPYGNASTIINAPFNKGAVLFVMNMRENGIIQLALDRTAGSLSNVVIRRFLDTGWSEWKNFYGDFNKPTPADIGAASIGELVGCWKAYRWVEAGWRRVASIASNSCESCVISIKQQYSNLPSECHKVELINTYSSSIFKSVHDKTDENNKLLTKIRIVKISNKLYMDVYYDSISRNLLTVTISDAVSCTGESWSMLSDSIVPEIATGETILAEMNFQANSWLGGPLE